MIPADCEEVEVRGRKLILAPLNFDQLPALAKEFETVGNATAVNGMERMKALAVIIHASAQENQPDLGLQDVAKLLNAMNADAVFLKVLDISGLRARGEVSAGSGSQT